MHFYGLKFKSDNYDKKESFSFSFELHFWQKKRIFFHFPNRDIWKNVNKGWGRKNKQSVVDMSRGHSISLSKVKYINFKWFFLQYIKRKLQNIS